MADLAVVEQAAKDLMAEHGLTGWRFDWDNAVRRAGGTHHQTRIITLSRQITAANDEAHALNVILHEIAHALAGPRQGHGP